MNTTNINNWKDLTEQIQLLIEKTNNKILNKLLIKINQHLKSNEKNNKNFNLTVVKENEKDLFYNYLIMYEQILIEPDIIDIFTEISSLISNYCITINLYCIGKWIKIYSGNGSKLGFYDSEKTILNDKNIVEFLNKMENIRSEYYYFNRKPIIYYKFKTLPNIDVIEYLQKFDISCIEFTSVTTTIDHVKIDEKNSNVCLDQTILITLCSNLSYGLSTSFYIDNKEGKTKDKMLNNKLDLDNFINGRKLFVNESTFEQVNNKIKVMGGNSELNRFKQLEKRLIIVPDIINKRFYKLKDHELIYASIAESTKSIIITGNHKFANKLANYYPELLYKLFITAQLSENKFN